jgi:hypothetical protein
VFLGLHQYAAFLCFEAGWCLVIPEHIYIDTAEKVRATSTQHVGNNGGHLVLFTWFDRLIDRGNEVIQGRIHDWACCLSSFGNRATTGFCVHALFLL